jgi:hypothetical protein
MKPYESDRDKNNYLDGGGTKERNPTGANRREEAGKKESNGAQGSKQNSERR